MGALLSKVFPCMSTTKGEPGNPDSIVIDIRSTSSCCKGKTVQLKLDSSQVSDLSRVIAELIESKNKN